MKEVYKTRRKNMKIKLSYQVANNQKMKEVTNLLVFGVLD